jgi:hypothetical protein
MDATGGIAFLSYARWYSNNSGPSPQSDSFYVQISGNGGLSWSVLERVGPGGPDVGGGWIRRRLAVPAALATSLFKVRFTVADAGNDSTIEAGVDDVKLEIQDCTPPCLADFNADGTLDFFDYDDFTACFEGTAPCPPETSADFNADGAIDFFDYDDYLQAFEAGC